jgi:hypothetical protein
MFYFRHFNLFYPLRISSACPGIRITISLMELARARGWQTVPRKKFSRACWEVQHLPG